MILDLMRLFARKILRCGFENLLKILGVKIFLREAHCQLGGGGEFPRA